MNGNVRKNDIKVSAYCLVYNHEKYLRSALEGFVNQDVNFKYEVFVHDDASTDGSKKIIEEFAAQYPEIIKTIYQQENQYSKGTGIFQTFILPKLNGRYVAVCEGDDCWTDSLKLQRQADFLDRNPDYVACVHNTTMKDMTSGKSKKMYCHAEDTDIYFADTVRGGSCAYHTSSLMYRVEYTKNRPDFFTKARYIGDYPLAIYLTLSGRMRFLNYDMSLYRLGTANSWTDRNKADLHTQALTSQGIADMLTEVDHFTNYEYHDLLQGYILKHQYQYLYFVEKYGELRKEPYRKVFLSEPLSERLKIYAKQYLNGLYHGYRKLRYGKNGK